MKAPAQGFSLIELVVVMAIISILLATGASGFQTWLANTRTRGAAEAIQAGLHLARAEAVRRNAQIRFQLTSTIGNDCALSLTSSNWVISYDNPAGLCGGAMLNEAFADTDAANNPAPRIIQVRPAAEGSNTIVVAADQSTFTFNGLGRLAAVPATNPVVISVTNPGAGTCVADGGQLRCLRVTVSLGGQVRMCDPALPAGGTDPQRC